MQYTPTEIEIREKITTEYRIDGINYQADLTTFGSGGKYEKDYFKTSVSFLGVGKVQVYFPEKNMLDSNSKSRPTRLTLYAETKLAEAVKLFFAASHMARKRGFTLTRLDLHIRQ